MTPAGSSANWAAARELCPAGEYDSTDWHRHYIEHPDVLLQMLGDIYRVYKGEERKRNGTSNPQGGRRKSQIDGSIEDLLAIVTPRFSMDPFPVAFKELLGTRSLRAFALKAGMDFRDLSRKLRGGAKVTRYDYERIARAADVHPAFFVEWRSSVILDLLADVFAARPNLSITMLKALSR